MILGAQPHGAPSPSLCVRLQAARLLRVLLAVTHSFLRPGLWVCNTKSHAQGPAQAAELAMTPEGMERIRRAACRAAAMVDEVRQR